MRGVRGQTAVNTIIAVGAALFIGILIIFSVYEGTVEKDYTNESLGDATNNTITYFTTDNTPIASTGIEIRNASGGVITEQSTAPGWQLESASNGNISINYTGYDVGAASDATYADYTNTKITGTALTSAQDVEGYLWIGIGFFGLGLLVLGAVYILRIIRQMGG